MTATPKRRQLVMAVLLALAAVGAAVRFWSPNPSLARDIGTLMLVLWLPAVGNLIAYLVRQAQTRMHQRAGFDARPQFTAHFAAQLLALPERAALVQSLSAADTRCTLLIGTEGFSARTPLPLRELLASAQTAEGVSSSMELLKPALALPRFAPGTRFHLVVGNTAIAAGTVLVHGETAANR
ncbi:MAG: hypothetical protein H7255_11305 [Ramlibacter sp.]|nr:hypothetical protein [Ramlibacter sp.]